MNNEPKVLIVSSECMMTSLLRMMLIKDDWDIISTRNECEACNKLAFTSVDLVLFDIAQTKANIPSSIGMMYKHFDAPIIVLSAFSQEGIIKQMLDAGASAHITKPFQADKLRAAIDRNISSAKYRQLPLEKCEL